MSVGGGNTISVGWTVRIEWIIKGKTQLQSSKFIQLNRQKTSSGMRNPFYFDNFMFLNIVNTMLNSIITLLSKSSSIFIIDTKA